MRAGAVATAAALVGLVALVACTGGDGGGRAAPGPPTTGAPSSTTSTVPVTTSTSTTVPATDPPGSVTLTATALTLPADRPGGGGLRMLVRPATPRVTVRRRGRGGAVTACPAVDVAGPAGPGGCAPLEEGRPVELAAWGVDLRAPAGDASIDEVSLAYAPADRSITLVTPTRPAGSCGPASPCRATFSVTPARAGSFSLDGRAGGGRPRLVLSNSGSITPLVTVEGGGNLSIRATVDGGSPATLAYSEESTGAVPALTAEILWP